MKYSSFIMKFVKILNGYLFYVMLFVTPGLTQVNTQIIDLPTINWNVPLEEISYKIALGDLNGDKQTDYVVLAWWDANDGRNEITQKIYAFFADGTFAWPFDTNVNTGSDNFYDPMTTVSINVWDLDGDGRDEVITQQNDSLVVLDGLTGSLLNAIELKNPKGFIFSTIAFLTLNEPYIVVAHGKDLKVRAFKKDLTSFWEFADTSYAQTFGLRLSTWDLEDDGRDEIVCGPLILSPEGSIKFCGIKEFTERSFVHDFDPTNPGYEQFLFVGSFDYGSEEWIGPLNWKGPYLFSIADSTILWHEGGDSVSQTGWGRPHRGWIAEYDTASPGLEIYMNGLYWRGDEYQRYLNGEYDDGRRPWGGKEESDFIVSAEGESVQEIEHHVCYPVQWNQDPETEIFLYREGRLFEGFAGYKLLDNLAKAYGSSEAVCIDMLGDYREEIIVGSLDKLYIYSNSDSSDYKIPSPRLGHQYKLNFARTASGFWKPQPIDPRFNQPDSIFVISPNGGEQFLSTRHDTIRWTTKGKISTVAIEFSPDNGKSWINVTDSTENDGSFLGMLPTTLTDQAIIKISNFYDSTTYDQSDETFSILGLVPVELSFFKAHKLDANKITLEWGTESERNNFGFFIQRKYFDEKYEDIGFKKSHQISSSFHKYVFLDSVTTSGVYFYRLKQIDINGSIQYSNEVSVNMSVPTKFFVESNYPNPFNNSTSIRFFIPQKELVTIEVYSIRGRLIKTILNRILDSGKHKIVWHGDNDAGNSNSSGIYYIKFFYDNQVEILKTVLIK